MIIRLEPEGWVEVDIRSSVAKRLVDLVLGVTSNQVTPADYLQACNAVDAYLTEIIDSVENRAIDLAASSDKA